MSRGIFKSGKFWIGILISAVFLYFAFRNIDFRALAKVFLKINPWWVAAGVGLYYVNLGVRAIRWQYIYRHVKKVSFWGMFGATVVGYFANNVLPMRLGEVARAVYIGEKEGTDKSASLGTIAVERIFDGILAMIVLGMTFVLFELPPEVVGQWKMYFRRAGEAFAAVSLIGLLIMMVMVRQRDWTLRVIDRIVSPMPEKFRAVTQRLAFSFIDGLKILSSPLEVFVLLLLSAAVWGTNLFPLYCMGSAFGVKGMQFGFADMLFVLTAGSVAAAIPASPGFVGTFHYATKLAISIILTVKFNNGGFHAVGIKPELFGEWGLSYAIVTHALYILTTTITGAIWVIVSGVSFSKLRGGTEPPGDGEATK